MARKIKELLLLASEQANKKEGAKLRQTLEEIDKIAWRKITKEITQ